MARKDKLIASKSLYTIRKRHQVTSNGTIYENDYTTIFPNEALFSSEVPLFADSNFIYRIRATENKKKRHARSGWIKPDESVDNVVWTKENITADAKANDNKIIAKPNYESLKDFAYYGSAVELIHATINDIILRFPGGISYYGKNAPSFTDNFGNKHYLLSNEFEIDCWTSGNIASGSVENPMRILAASYVNYETGEGKPVGRPIFVPKESTCKGTIIGTVNIGEETVEVFLDKEGKKHLCTSDGEKALEHKVIIRPRQQFIDEFWNNIDDFERVLLNRDSTPVYKAVFETPYKNETGYYYINQSYVWPTIGNDGFTPDISTGAFQGYLSSLISLAEFHDSIDSDNIWRMMTHESIKNLDWTFVDNQENATDDGASMDTSRIQAILRIYGRAFDDLKRNADTIKAISSLSYDEKNNVPDYFISDRVSEDGWTAKNVSPSSDDSIKTDTISGTTNGKTWVFEKSGKTGSDVNVDFLRKLALSSDYIQSMKGTRRGIETLLGMFGYQDATNKNNSCTYDDLNDNSHTTLPGTYDLTEYIAVAKEFPMYEEMSRLRALGEYVNYDENSNFMDGYPVVPVRPAGLETDDKSKYYLIPWFDAKTTYKFPFYFQGKGGWGKRNSKEINLSITSIKELPEVGEMKIFGETEPYIRYASDIDGLLAIPNTDVTENMICYVTDITSIYESYSADASDNDKTDFSHYFILKNTALSAFVGFVSNDIYNCYGWRNIYSSEFDGTADLTEDGARVLHQESIVSEYEGNNPHAGNGEYDLGNDYLSNYNSLFGKAVATGDYDFLKNGDDEDNADYVSLLSAGFKTDTIVDNKKCHFYQDSLSEKSGLKAISGEESKLDDAFFQKLNKSSEEAQITAINDECFANSIINIKNLRINFGTGENQYLRQYIRNVVLKYLEEMIPSTTILSYSFDGEKPTMMVASAFDKIGESKTITADMVMRENDDKNAVYWTESNKVLNK